MCNPNAAQGGPGAMIMSLEFRHEFLQLLKSTCPGERERERRVDRKCWKVRRRRRRRREDGRQVIEEVAISF
jgi:hypothetical protein